MSAVSFQDVAELFDRVIEAGAGDRAAILDGADVAVAEEVRRLLAVEEAAAVLDDPVWDLTGVADEDGWVGLPAGIRVGGFTIVSLIARGGSGAVYRARQDDPARDVALKVPAAPFASRAAEGRFRREAQMLARLQHPGIAQVIQAGTFEFGGAVLPYFAMELIEGRPITEYQIADEGSALESRFELLARACDAVEHAHQRGVIHRDLKPSNILIDAAGQPRVLDFGIATLSDVGLRGTMTGEGLVGTVSYMSPEQVGGGLIDTRSDIYSLGVVAFEVLTGRLPYTRVPTSLFEGLEIIRRGPDVRAPSLRSELRGDADAVLARALEAEPERRYQNAGALAADLRALARGEPVSTGPPTTRRMLRLMVRKHRVLAAAAAAAVVALTLGGSVAAWQAVRAVRAQERAAARSESLLHLARSLVGFTSGLRVTPGSHEARSAILEQVLPALDDLAAQEDATPEVLRAVAEGYVAMASHVGYFRASNLGRTDEAVEMLGKALAIYSRPGVGDQERIASTLLILSECEAFLARIEEADAHFGMAVDAFTRIAMEEPSRMSRWYSVADAVERRTMWLANSGRFDDAKGRLREAERLFAPLEGLTVEGAEDSYQLSNVWLSLGGAWKHAAEHESALNFMDRSLAPARRALELEPESHPYITGVANVQRYRGIALTWLGRAAESADALEEAEELYRRATEISPGRMDTADIRATTLQLLATAQSDAGRHEEAMKTASEATRERDALLAAEPQSMNWRRNGAITHWGAARVWKVAAEAAGVTDAQRRDRMAAAVEAITRALDLARGLKPESAPHHVALVEKIGTDERTFRERFRELERSTVEEGPTD